MNEPEIRFTDKDGNQYPEWEEKKLGEVTEQQHSSTLTADKLINGGRYPVWNGGRTPYGYYNDFNNENALVIASRGEAGHPTYVSGKFWAGGLCYPMTGDEKHDTAFLANDLLAHETRFRQELVSQTSIPAVNKSDVLDYKIGSASSLSEQHDIGSFFSLVDEKIKTEEAMTESLKKAKSALLDGMFPKDGENVPRIRFDGFTDPWEQRKLGELGTLKNGMNFSKDAMGIGYPFVNLQNIFGNNFIDVSKLGLAMASPSQLKDYRLQKGDVLFVRSSVKLEGVGEAALVSENLENTTYSGFIIRFHDETGLDNNFKRFVFKTDLIRNQIISQATDSANKNISQQVLSDLEVMVPSKEEQHQIGTFFSNLDNLITLHQRECQKWKDIKTALLQHMF